MWGTIRKLPLTQAHTLPIVSRTVAGRPSCCSSEAGLATLHNSFLCDETEPALSLWQRGTVGFIVFNRFDFKTAFGPGPSYELHK